MKILRDGLIVGTLATLAMIGLGWFTAALIAAAWAALVLVTIGSAK